jgi:hypothetical protein
MAQKQSLPIFDLAEECRALSARIQNCRLALPIILADDAPDAEPAEDLRDILKLSAELAALGAGVMDEAGLFYSTEGET